MKKIILLLLILSTILFSTCDYNTKTMRVPAVMGENAGGLLELEVTVLPGEGRIFSSIIPRIGSSTQLSQERAVFYAFDYTNNDLDECDVLFEIKNAEKSRFIDGPSAGAVMTSITIAALENKTIRNDIIISGTIEENGQIGPVGGIAEKVKAADKFGKQIFLTKITGVREYLTLAGLEGRYGVQIIEIETAEELMNIIFDETGSSVQPKPMQLTQSIITPNLNDLIIDQDAERFKLISLNMTNDMELRLQTLKLNSNSSTIKEFITYFDEEIRIQKILINKGYVFTGANQIFLSNVDLTFLEHVKLNNIKVNESVEQTKECLGNLKTTNKKLDDWQWNTGADMRHNWAEDKIHEVETNYHITNSEDEEYTSLYNALYSQSWCQISSQLTKNGKSIEINESILQDLALKNLAEAKDYVTFSPNPSGDAIWHIKMGEKAKEEGEYLAAIFESKFAISLQDASDGLVSSNQDYIKLKTNEMLNKEYQSLWGNLYQGQGKYLYTSDEDNSAYQVLLLADYLEQGYYEILTELENNNENINNQTNNDNTNDIIQIETEIVIDMLHLGLFTLIMIQFAIIINLKRNRKV